MEWIIQIEMFRVCQMMSIGIFKVTMLHICFLVCVHIYRVGLPPLEIKEQYHTRTKLRALWGKYGQKTGIDPKLCWPTPDEMDETIDDERVYNMELSEKIKIVKERREAKQKEFDQM